MTYPPRMAASMKRLLQYSIAAGGSRALVDRSSIAPGRQPAWPTGW